MESIHKLAFGFLLLFIFVLPTDGIVDTVGLPLVKLFGLLTFALTTLFIITGGNIRGSGYFLLLCLVYVIWIIFSFLWTPMTVDYEISQAINSQQSIKVSLYLLFTVLLVFQLVRSESELQWIMLAFVLGAGWLAAFFLMEYDPSALTIRHQVKNADSNEITVVLAAVMTMAAYLLGWGWHWAIRLCALIYIPLALFAIMATGSRTGLILLVLASLAFVPLVLKASTWIKVTIPLFLVAALIFAAQQIPEKTMERLFSTGKELSSGTLNERSIIWAKAYEEWAKNPLFGHGLGSFRRVVNKHNVDYTAHNSLVSIAVEQGLLGMLLYLGIMLCAIFYSLQLADPQKLIFFSLLLVICIGQMSLTLYKELYIWLLYSLVIVTRYNQQINPAALYSKSQYTNHKTPVYRKIFTL